MEDARHAEARARIKIGEEIADEIAISKAAKELRGEIEAMVNRRTEEILQSTAEKITVLEADEQVQTKGDIMYYVPLSESDRGTPGVVCTCGRGKYHARFKVLRTWADKHRNKTGHLFGEKPKD